VKNCQIRWIAAGEKGDRPLFLLFSAEEGEQSLKKRPVPFFILLETYSKIRQNNFIFLAILRKHLLTNKSIFSIIQR